MSILMWIGGGLLLGVVGVVIFAALAARDRHDLGYVSGQWIAQHRSADGYDS